MLTFPDINIQSFQDKFSLVHFMTPGNNFVWSIFWLASKSVSWTVITLSGDTKTCTKEIRWLYYNSQRGKRIRPLDSETLALLQQQNSWYNNLTINGWLYTTCENTNPYGVFWAIQYIRWWVTWYIVAGTRLDYHQNKIFPHFARTLQYFDNKTLIGYLYDSNGGIGFVGGSLTGDAALISYLNSWESINSWFMYSWDTIVSNHTGRTIIGTSGNTAMETMRNIIIQGSVGLSQSMDTTERLSLLGNFKNKTVIYNGSNINSSTVINFAKQKAQELCQGQEIYPSSILWITQENIICTQNVDLTIDLSNTPTYENKTIIVKNANVVLQGSMTGASPSLDLFVDKWLLYLPSDPFTLETFDDQWFPSASAVSSWLYLKWNFIINGLMIGGTTGFNHKLHLQGKITTLNTPIIPTTGRVAQIENLFGWSSIYDGFISLQNIFVRQCGFNGISSDGTPCSTWGVISTTPLVILNGNYPSNIVQ